MTRASPSQAAGGSPKRPPAVAKAECRSTVVVRNRQRTRALSLPLVRRLTRWLLADCFRSTDFQICIHLVGTKEITTLNWGFLRHQGSTDVITFDHSLMEAVVGPAGSREPKSSKPCGGASSLHGEIFISIDEAVAQSRPFSTTWQSELARYIIHGLLHLSGYDDLESRQRRRMKREEDRLLDLASRQFALGQLGRRAKKRGEAAHG